MKILNLYAGIGGNRKLWGNDHEITAVELNPEIAKIYSDFFPNDKMIVADAHEYLLHNYMNFDFIWSSPPCPTHSRFRFMTTKMTNEKFKRDVCYADMNLYQEIILLSYYFKGKFCVENVKGYYKPLIKPQESGRHYFWCNFVIKDIKSENNNFIKKHSNNMRSEFDLNKYKTEYRKDQILRNCVNSELGLHILNCSLKKTIQLNFEF